MYNFLKHITLNEGHTPKTLTQLRLPYKRDDLEPCISEDTVKYHYDKLYKGYVDRYNNGEGDQDFNEAGAFLHNLYFEQLESQGGAPHGKAEELINSHFKNWDDFKTKFEKVAMGIQGSGWVYLSRGGEIKTIKNHEIKMDVVLLIDWWEHAWALDYQSDKKSYLRNHWKIINWSIINARIV